jgi:predicted nucleic acid-binding protein
VEQTVTVVSNSSPLIALHHLDQLDLCATLFGTVLIPPAVSHETFQTRSRPGWIEEHALAQPLSALVLRGRLGVGEREAIALAAELNADLLLLDDAAARRTAISIGLRVVGTFGILLQAKERQLLPSVKPLIDQLLAFGFHADDELVAAVLHFAGESAS